jgi:multicomponent Na+:H+ antiporter subunit E
MGNNANAIINRFILFTLLFATWITLSGHFTPLLLGIGAASCFLITALSSRLPDQSQVFSRLWAKMLRAPVYTIWLLKEILLSSIQVAKIIWTPTLPISPAIGWVSTKQRDDVSLTTFAISITLTPGTVSVLVEEQRIYVHALEKSGIDALKEGEMDRCVKQLMEGIRS